MSLAERNKITPQMIDYDQIGDQWVPYIMRFDSPGKKFKSVSTDEWGFRNSIDKDGNLYNQGIAKTKKTKVNLIIGSSAVFGVGATNDLYTISSWLNKKTSEDWLNFGGRAFNSTQELLLFQMFLPQNIDKIIICSGVNNLTLSYLSQTTSPIYNSFFSQSIFVNAMNHPPGAMIGLRKAFSTLVKEIKFKFQPPKIEIKSNLSSQYQDILFCYERDLRLFKSIADGIGAKLFFALQPLATWVDKKLSQEEKKLFYLLDQLSNDWQVISNQIVEHRYQYRKDIQKFCNEKNIPFFDLNDDPSFLTSDWLFVDRIHLTDLGYERIANQLIKEFQL